MSTILFNVSLNLTTIEFSDVKVDIVMRVAVKIKERPIASECRIGMHYRNSGEDVSMFISGCFES